MYIDCLVYFSFLPLGIQLIMFFRLYLIFYGLLFELYTVELRNEICTYYEKAGSPGGFKCVPIKSGELRLKCFDSNLLMTQEIFNPIKRI